MPHLTVTAKSEPDGYAELLTPAWAGTCTEVSIIPIVSTVGNISDISTYDTDTLRAAFIVRRDDQAPPTAWHSARLSSQSWSPPEASLPWALETWTSRSWHAIILGMSSIRKGHAA
ncbi:hypothetical protein Misp01_49880 [Microtetraspora sp. NBRC 13810]|nr:hypothetical protein Misp01_49880 [Microtetraspora sp. NBRC 13810]